MNQEDSELKAEPRDAVNHPGHYNQYTGFEVIDVAEQLRAPDGTGNYNRGNAFKYLARAGWKDADKQIEDLEKARFYIQREIDRLWLESLGPKGRASLAQFKGARNLP